MQEILTRAPNYSYTVESASLYFISLKIEPMMKQVNDKYDHTTHRFSSEQIQLLVPKFRLTMTVLLMLVLV